MWGRAIRQYDVKIDKLSLFALLKILQELSTLGGGMDPQFVFWIVQGS